MLIPKQQLLNLPPRPNKDGTYNATEVMMFFQKLYNLLGSNSTAIPAILNSMNENLKPIVQGSQWPIGSVFTTAGNTNPNSLLGFGNWEYITGTTYQWKRTA